MQCNVFRVRARRCLCMGLHVMLRLAEANAATSDARDQIERQNRQLSDNEAAIKLLRRQVEDCGSDRERDRRQIATLQQALSRARAVSIAATASSYIHVSFSKFSL